MSCIELVYVEQSSVGHSMKTNFPCKDIWIWNETQSLAFPRRQVVQQAHSSGPDPVSMSWSGSESQ